MKNKLKYMQGLACAKFSLLEVDLREINKFNV